MSYIDIFGTLFDASIDGVNLSSYNFYCYDIKKPLMPKQSQTIVDIPKMSGVIQSDKKFTTGNLILYGYIECTDYDDLTTKIEALSAALYSDSDVPLISSKQTDRYWNVQYFDNVIVEQKDNYALVNLEFTCNDPFAYDITPDSNDQIVTVNDTEYTVANSGHYYAFPVITITFNQAQNHIYVENSSVVGNHLDISKSFADGDVLEIDCKNNTVKLNGSSSMAGFGDGGLNLANWIMLAKGSNTIKVGTTDPSIAISINITFSKPYLY